VDSFLNVISIAKKTKDYTMDSDLLSLTKAARVAPLCIVSKNLAYSEHYKDILNTNLDVFASIYMSAIPMVNVIGKVKVVNLLGQLNPDRDLDTFVGIEDDSNTDSYGTYVKDYLYGLPSSSVGARTPDLSPAIAITSDLPLGLEDADDVEMAIDDAKEFYKTHGRETSHGSSAASGKIENTAVGKDIVVTLQNEDVTMNVNVNLRLDAVHVESDIITAVLSGEKVPSMSERYHKWRAGRISFLTDYVLGLDLLDNHKKLMMKDDVGFYEESLARSRKGKLWGLLLRSPSLAEASNIYIIDRSTKKAIEREYKGKFKDKKVRKEVFGITKALIFCVVDEEAGMMEMHYRGIKRPSIVRLKDITGKKDSGDKIVEYMLAANKSQAPSF
jgi:hypothetical protein